MALMGIVVRKYPAGKIRLRLCDWLSEFAIRQKLNQLIAEECEAELETDRLLPTNELWTTNAVSAFLKLTPNSERGISYSDDGQCGATVWVGVD